MMPKRNSVIFFFAAALCLAAVPRVQGQNQPFFLSPSGAEAAKPFKLSVLSYRYGCDAVFSHHEIVVGKSRIDLAFVTERTKGIMCPAVAAAFGPDFNMQALAAGRYEVWANDRAPCLVAPQPCEIAERPESAGVLTVGADGKGWFLRPNQVKAGTAFQMQLLDEQYGNCNTSFTHTALEFRNGSIYASYLIESHPEKLCLTDIHPNGPSYEVKALTAGKYPVYEIQMYACEFDQPPCMLPKRAPQLVDTLSVTAATGLRLSYSPGGIPARVSIRNGLVEIPLPASGNTRRVERLNLSGRHIGTKVLP